MEEMILYSTLALLLLGIMMLSFFTIYRFRLNRHIQEKKDLEVRSTEALLQSQIEIREHTLKNVALEIHDNIAQVLSLAKMTMSSASKSQPNEMLEKLNESRSLVGKAIQDLRDLSRIMNPDQVSSIGLKASLTQQVELIRKAGGPEISLQLNDLPEHVDKRKELILYRMLQEALQNILKHAGARRISLTAAQLPDAFQISIADDGKGFNPKQATAGQGLRNLQHRAVLIGGDCHIKSKPGSGTTIIITMPLIA